MPGTAADGLTFVDQFGGVSRPGRGSSNPTTSRSTGRHVYVADGSNTGSDVHAQRATPAPVRHVRRGRLRAENRGRSRGGLGDSVRRRPERRASCSSTRRAFREGLGLGRRQRGDAFETCTAASLCEIGTSVNSGTKIGGFFNPQTLAVDAGGDVYVSEFAGDQRIQRFDPTPIVSFVTGWARPVPRPASSRGRPAWRSTRRRTSSSPTATTPASRSSPRPAASFRPSARPAPATGS